MVNFKKIIFSATAIVFFIATVHAQEDTASQNWSLHFQSTVTMQKHLPFSAKYSGKNSLKNEAEPVATSLTATIFAGRKLWKNAAVYFNPEMSGGSGLSHSLGVAGALNGETYRVDQTAPKVFLARAYLQQHIPLRNTDYEYQYDDDNAVAGKIPTKRITLMAGQFAISDFFDNNKYAKDPRTQFTNWSIWANGAWDYPANTQGYTKGLVAEYIVPHWQVRFSSVAVARIANFHLMEYNAKAHSETVEIEHNYFLKKRPGVVRLIMSNTFSQAPSYADALQALASNDTTLLKVMTGDAERKKYGGKKFGVFLNAEQEISDDAGVFLRLGWNDGKYASWAFTEIDRTAVSGISVNGNKWKRANDNCSLALAFNGISKQHSEFLKRGGYGFIIGEGKLNYAPENIVEFYYSAQFAKFMRLTFDYQFVNNPGYNKDRGPVHAFGLRAHFNM